MGDGDGWPGILPPIPTPGMLWVAPQEIRVNVAASNTSNAILRRIISDLHGRRLGLSEELDASVTKRVAAMPQVNSGRERPEWDLSYELAEAWMWQESEVKEPRRERWSSRPSPGRLIGDRGEWLGWWCGQRGRV